MESFSLSTLEKEILLLKAHNALNSFFGLEKVATDANIDSKSNLRQTCGIFVSIYRNNQLRGCLGQFTSTIPLIELVHEMTISSAINDTRFSPIKKEEINELDIEISVLTPLKKVNSINEIQLGKHGIYIKKGANSGTFLPQVTDKTNWNLEEFLGHCSRDKAGIGWDGWKDAEIYTYEAIVINENNSLKK